MRFLKPNEPCTRLLSFSFYLFDNIATFEILLEHPGKFSISFMFTKNHFALLPEKNLFVLNGLYRGNIDL